ncbi:MAG: YihY/virulence factor BrkB family protein [Bacteroidota bacterium]
MYNSLRKLFTLLKQTGQAFWAQRGLQKSAAFAYYTVFALPGLLLITLSVASVAFDAEHVQRQVLETLGTYLGTDTAGTIEAMIAHVRSQATDLTVATTGGVLALLFGATGAFSQLQVALNEVWGIDQLSTRGGFKRFLKKRLLSFFVVLGMGFLLMLSLVSRALVAFIDRQMNQVMAESIVTTMMTGALFLLFFLITTLLIAILFKALPDLDVSWGNVIAGALVTAIGFTIGKELMSYFISNSNFGSAFGAASSLAVILVWIYFSGAVLFFGAAFSREWSQKD